MGGEATVAERCLLYLLDRAETSPESPAAEALVQDRVASALGTRRAHVSREMVRFQRSGLVRAAHVHLRGAARRRLAYFLTEAGLRAAKETRSKLENSRVLVKDLNGEETERALYEVPGLLPRHPKLSELIGNIVHGRLDLQEFLDRQARIHRGKVFDLGEAVPASHFVGRNAELARLSAFLHDPRARGCLVVGLPGIGKTALSAQWANTLGGRVHILWRRLRSDTTGAALLREVAGALRNAGRPALWEHFLRPPETASDASLTLLRRDTKDMGLVLVLDDAHLAGAEVANLLRILSDVPPAETLLKLVLLARERPRFCLPADIALGKLWELEVDDLPRSDAETILVSAGVEESRRRLILDRCGGHPLSLELAASGRVSFERVRMVSAARLMEEVISRIRAPHLRALQLAAIFDEGVLRIELGPSADELVRMCLLRETAAGRLQMHDLVREAVLSGLPSNRIASLHRRAGEILSRSHEAHDTIIASRHFLVGRAFSEAEAVLERRGEDLIEAGFASALMPVLEELASSVRGQISRRLLLLRGHALFALGRWAEAARAYDQCTLVGDPLIVAEALLGHGKALVQRHSGLGLTQLIDARERFEGLGALRLLAEAQYWIGGLYEDGGASDKARDAYERGRAVAFDVGDRRWQGLCTYGVGRVRSLNGDIVGAVEEEQEAFSLLEREGSRLEVAKVCVGLGGNLLELARHAEAETYLSRGASEARATGALGILASALYNLGSLRTVTQRKREAIGFFEEALGLYESLEQYDRAAWCAAWIAHALWAFGDEGRGSEYWRRADRFVARTREPALRIRALRRMANAALDAEKFEEGEESLQRALEESLTTGLTTIASELQDELAAHRATRHAVPGRVSSDSDRVPVGHGSG